MSKKDKVVKPFVLPLEISLEGLDGVPADTGSTEITRNWIMGAFKSMGEGSRGFNINNQRKLKIIRDVLDEAIKTKAKVAEFEPEDWRFIKEAWDQAVFPFGANEVLVRIDANIKKCISDHDRENVELKPEPVVPSAEVK